MKELRAKVNYFLRKFFYNNILLNHNKLTPSDILTPIGSLFMITLTVNF